MILIVINSILNGWIIQYFFQLISPWHFQRNEYFLMGYGTSAVLTVLGTSKYATRLVNIFINNRAPIGRETEIIKPLLEEVIQKSNTLYHTEFDYQHLNVRVKDCTDLNAQAIGTNTIVITTGLINDNNDGQMVAVLAHELAHLYYKDSMKKAALVCANAGIALFNYLYTAYSYIARIITKNAGAAGNISGGILGFIVFLPTILFLPVIICNWIGQILFTHSMLYLGRQYEHRADFFAVSLGYRDELISFLEKINQFTETDNSLIGKINATHPSPITRIGKIEDAPTEITHNIEELKNIIVSNDIYINDYIHTLAKYLAIGVLLVMCVTIYRQYEARHRLDKEMEALSKAMISSQQDHTHIPKNIIKDTIPMQLT